VLTGKKILITGGTGVVGRPVAEALAKENEVWVLGRFGDPAVKSALEAQGIRTHRWDLGVDDLDGVPDDISHVMHAAVLKGVDDYDVQIEANGTATAQLMLHCRNAEAFLFVSASAVYKRLAWDHVHTESDPLGGDSPYLGSYATQKIGCEAIVRAVSRTLALPSVIGRLSVTYGPQGHGGLPVRFCQLMLDGTPIPVPIGHDNLCMPMHTDDVARQVPLLWQAASVPTLVLNWCGDDIVGQRQMMTYISELAGARVTFAETDENRASFALDNTKRRRAIGPCEVDWREGVRSTIAAHFPNVGPLRS
jgi:nucleoside-diphosphate-sugar epimerase